MSRFRYVKFLVLIAFLTPCVLWPRPKANETIPGRGSIHGHVIDERGEPVAGAEVDCEVADRPPMGLVVLNESGRPLRPQTDIKGQFDLQNIYPGRYSVCALKEAAGYPDTRKGWFAQQAPCPTVTVQANQNVSDVDIRLGPKAQRLSGRVVDATKGRSLGPGLVGVYEGSDSPVVMFVAVNKSGYFEMLVPFDNPFRIRVTVQGYQMWYYGEDDPDKREKVMKVGKDSPSMELLIPMKAGSNGIE